MATVDVREIENRVERVPAAPNRLHVMNVYSVRAGAEAEFEGLWREQSVSQLAARGCEFVRLHRDIEKPLQYVTYDLWKDRAALISAIRAMGEMPAYPIVGRARLTFVQLVDHVDGALREAAKAQ